LALLYRPRSNNQENTHDRYICGAGQWLEEKHGAKSHRGWRKLHLALDVDSGEIIAHSLTDQDTSDGSQVEPLLGQIEDGQFTGDGAYDGDPTYNAVPRHSVQAKIVIPPRSTAVGRQDAEPPNQRECHVASIQAGSRLKWQATTGYGNLALVETAMGRYKGSIGRRLRARPFRAQQTEAALGAAALNRMLVCARPRSVRCKAVTATSK